MRKNKTIIVSALFVLLFVVTSMISLPYGLRINQTNSLPYKLFFSKPIDKIAPNTYVMFNHPASPIPLVKCVIGVPGDQISREEATVLVNNKAVGKCLEHSPSGKILTPIEPGNIPKGFIFVCATHPESFDSRYQEFGLINIEAVKEILWPLF